MAGFIDEEVAKAFEDAMWAEQWLQTWDPSRDQRPIRGIRVDYYDTGEEIGQIVTSEVCYLDPVEDQQPLRCSHGNGPECPECRKLDAAMWRHPLHPGITFIVVEDEISPEEEATDGDL